MFASLCKSHISLKYSFQFYIKACITQFSACLQSSVEKLKLLLKVEENSKQKFTNFTHFLRAKYANKQQQNNKIKLVKTLEGKARRKKLRGYSLSYLLMQQQ